LETEFTTACNTAVRVFDTVDQLCLLNCFKLLADEPPKVFKIFSDMMVSSFTAAFNIASVGQDDPVACEVVIALLRRYI
jgi:hypothetical protein